MRCQRCIDFVHQSQLLATIWWRTNQHFEGGRHTTHVNAAASKASGEVNERANDGVAKGAAFGHCRLQDSFDIRGEPFAPQTLKRRLGRLIGEKTENLLIRLPKG